MRACPRLALFSFLVSLAPLTSAVAAPPAPAPLPSFLPWNLEALGKAPKFEWLDRTGKVHSLLYDGEPFRGKPTRTFAYYASPTTLGLPGAGGEKRYPGMVLIHGGGGHAFSAWAELYARAGYAAIAMDLGGMMGDDKTLKPNPEGGPQQDHTAKFHHPEFPNEDQWTYHSVANALLAHSLLRSFPDVDTSRTGVIGISWGGYLTCIVAGVDPRFKAALPLYGCGYLRDNSSWARAEFPKMSPEWSEKWVKLWDPASYVGSATMPMFFVNGTNDAAYPIDSYAKTYALVHSPKNIRIELNMKHGHWFNQKECLMYFAAQLKGEPPLPKVGPLKIEGETLSADVQSPRPLTSAVLMETKGSHKDFVKRPWTSRPLKIEGMHVEGPRPAPDATVYFINVTDSREATTSSTLHGPGLPNGDE